MKIVLLQQDIEWGQPVPNRLKAEKTILSQRNADIFLLPEMFATGFAVNPSEMAEPADGPTLQWMKRLSKATDAAIVGSIVVKENECFYNRMYFVCPDGSTTYYNKRHLFSYGEEDKHFSAGKERVIVAFRGFRFLLQVCYDLRFPVFCRNRKDYDAILYVANWPTSRIRVWQTLLRARAIENQCFVAGVNRVGSDPACNYAGNSAIIDAYGQTLTECATETEEVASAELDLPRLQSFRKKFPVLNDGDSFNLNF